MAQPDFARIQDLLQTAHDEGRGSLYEHECYTLFEALGLTAPAWRFVPRDGRPAAADLEALPGDRVVLKIVSPDIVHKTDVGGVAIVEKTEAAVAEAFDRMLREAPARQGEHLETNGHRPPEALEGLRGADLKARLAERVQGVLMVGFVQADARGLATELFVGLRHTDEFGPVLTAGVGGVEMEALAERARKGAAVALAPTGLVDGARFSELYRGTLSHARLSGTLRGSSRLVGDEDLVALFSAFVELANRFSPAAEGARFHLDELEVNPFHVAGGRLMPLDGVCSFRPASGAAAARPLAKIGNLLRPASAAVIGVSEKSMNMGRIILNNLFAAGFDRARAYVVRPGLDEIDGARCVPSIAELPEKVDLFVVAVGAAQVPDVVSDLIDHDRANAVILIPGGLGEKEGSQHVERDLKAKIAAAHGRGDGGPVFLGGNSLGVISHPGRYDTIFIPDNKLEKSRGEHERKLCFISQSGAFIISNLSRMPWLDPEFALSIGNQIDLTAGDLLSYIKDEPGIEVFGVYMEGFQSGDGLAFAQAVRETVALGKDVVFYKGGRTQEGRSATAGHTASVAGDYAVSESALTEAGAFVAKDFDEFGDLLRLCLGLRGTQVRGTRLAAVSNAGFEVVGIADGLENDGARLQLVRPSPEAAGKLAAALKAHRLDGLVDVKNPLDVTPMAGDAAYAELVGHLLDDPAVDALVAGVVPLTPAMQTLEAGAGHTESVDHPGSVAGLLPQAAHERDKPVVAVVDSGKLFDPLAQRLEQGGLPVFRSADRAVRVLAKYVNARLRHRP